LKISRTAIAGVIRIDPTRHGDARGWFSETFRDAFFREHVQDCTFVQDNQSYSAIAGTLRGLHFQTEPHAQAKLVRCIRGAIWDVAADIRSGSATYGQWVAEELSAENGCQLFIPAGFAHGFVTLTAECEVSYKVDAYYSPASDAGIAWNDPTLSIQWPLPKNGATVSDKDKSLPTLSDLHGKVI
jgi:dTDP-4-dehydrorhamnose 3,5-epimerase